MKLTPAHDHYAYAVWQRHPEIGDPINILRVDGKINENGQGEFRGQIYSYADLDRFEARQKVVEDLQALDLFDREEEVDNTIPISDRSKTPIEPFLSDQWFVYMGDREGKPGLAQMSMDAVTSGQIKFFPERYAKTYLDWLSEKRDWCISRQLWWGHRIPIWYTECPEAELKRVFGNRSDVCWRFDEEQGRWLVGSLEEDLPRDSIDPKYPLEQDPDVLDTWFSSQLWPHSTMGWPGPAFPNHETGPDNPDWEQMRYYYPTSVLVTSRDFIKLWVVRMVMAGLYNVGQIPFHHVYIHTKMLDGFGEGMSKSKGNGIDPLDIIDRYGTDALRFGIVNIATETQDSRMPVFNVCPHCDALVPVKKEHMYMQTRKVNCPECKKPFRPGGPWTSEDPELPTAKQASERFEEGRNFANKIWNAARFLLMNLEGYKPEAIRLEELPIEDRWILSRLKTTIQETTEALEGYHFSEMGRILYNFIWSEFCDWYVEMSKGRLRDDASRPLVQRVLVGVLDAILRLVHPIMPFVTESIWQALNEASFERGLPTPDPAAESVMIAPWPQLPPDWQDPAMEQRIGRMQELIRAVREVRNRYQVDAKTPLDVFIRCPQEIASDFQTLKPFLVLLSGVGQLEAGPDTKKPAQSASNVQPDFETFISLEGLIDVGEEIKRLEKQLGEKQKHLKSTEGKLTNENFVKKAPPEVVEEQRVLAEDLKKQIQSMETNLAELKKSLEG